MIRAVGRALIDQEVEAAQDAKEATRPPTAIEVRKRATHALRRARYSELKRLSEGGASVAGMARALDLDRKTVRVWLRQDAPPSWRRRRTVSTILDEVAPKMTGQGLTLMEVCAYDRPYGEF
ncbi:hypothetical protein ACLBXO_31365 [Methylobacterium sp. C33D]